MEDKRYITFIDNAGRNIFAGLIEQRDDSFVVENPVTIFVNQQQNGQMAVQLFPLFFAEFIEESPETGRKCQFEYQINNVALGQNFKVDPRIIQQYERIVNPTLVPVGETTEDSEPEVIKLFDE